MALPSLVGDTSWFFSASVSFPYLVQACTLRLYVSGTSQAGDDHGVVEPCLGDPVTSLDREVVPWDRVCCIEEAGKRAEEVGVWKRNPALTPPSACSPLAIFLDLFPKTIALSPPHSLLFRVAEGNLPHSDPDLAPLPPH